ncbi:MAG TPA: cytochrome P450 [Solirubrobacteraceae bacterium]|jgi:cytochrome P450|nr:cytochrome P450 [Solirubrobacteraceae bacterium]
MFYIGQAEPSPAGPAELDEPLRAPPSVALPKALQTLRFTQRQIQFVFRSKRELGDVFGIRFIVIPGGVVLTNHPDHVRSLFTAKPALVPSLTAESPLRPIVGPNSVLTANGPSHLRQRKLLLPPFHGEAVERYAEMIREVTERELDSWPIGRTFALAPKMQAITLDVIMSGIFGIDGRPARGTVEHRLRLTVKQLAAASTSPISLIGELANLGREEPVGLLRRAVGLLDRATYPVIEARRNADDLGERNDILSLLLRARTEDGEQMTDHELRDELLTLVLAGFETTANSLAWTWERLVRTPEAYERLREAVRADDEAEENVEAAIIEGMRSRPVIPIVGRRVAAPWRLGEYVVPAGQALSISILLVHHREDLYPDPFAFRPERWLGHTPGTYEWLPFGGGTRRCLGAALAMAEQREVLKAIVRRLDLRADRPEPEHAQHRNVTMIPARGARVIAARA